MDYCKKGDYVMILGTGQVGIIDVIVRRRTHDGDGVVYVQCGSGGPNIKTNMGNLRECSKAEYEEFVGLR